VTPRVEGRNSAYSNSAVEPILGSPGSTMCSPRHKIVQSKKENRINSCHQMSNFKAEKCSNSILARGQLCQQCSPDPLADLRGLFLREGGRKERGGKRRNGKRQKAWRYCAVLKIP